MLTSLQECNNKNSVLSERKDEKFSDMRMKHSCGNFFLYIFVIKAELLKLQANKDCVIS